jgi:hypothetical protein
LRRRRRQSTQIIHKKTASSPSASSYYSSPKPKRSGKKLLYFIAIVVILCGISYYFYNLNFKNSEGQKTDQKTETISTTPVETEKEEEPNPPPPAHNIQVEVLNGCGVNGVAKIFQSRLREKGIDVVNTENYVVNGKVYWNVDQTFIIDQIGVAEQAKAIAKALGIPLTLIESRQNPAAIYDISLVVGKDYRKYIQ